MKRHKTDNSRFSSSMTEPATQDHAPDLESYDVANAPPPMSSFSDLFVRLTWMALGPLGLAVSSIMNVSNGGGWVSGADGAFFFFLISMLVARWWEFRCGRALTADALPAQPGDLRRYVVTSLAIALPIWVVTNLVGNLYFSK